MTNSRTWHARLLTLGLAAGLALTACGEDTGGDDANSEHVDTGGPDDSGSEDYTDQWWTDLSVNVIAYPDRVLENGNIAVDPDLVPVEFSATLVTRPTAAEEEREQPVTNANVGIGRSDEGATNEISTNVELSHFGGGTYTGETVGAAEVYWPYFSNRTFRPRSFEMAALPFVRITAPLDGQSVSAASDLPVRFEPAGALGLTSVWLNGEEVANTSNFTEQDELFIPADKLSPGTHEISLQRFNVSISEGNGNTMYSFKRTITIVVE